MRIGNFFQAIWKSIAGNFIWISMRWRRGFGMKNWWPGREIWALKWFWREFWSVKCKVFLKITRNFLPFVILPQTIQSFPHISLTINFHRQKLKLSVEQSIKNCNWWSNMTRRVKKPKTISHIRIDWMFMVDMMSEDGFRGVWEWEKWQKDIRKGSLCEH